jgi:hypothetical protein
MFSSATRASVWSRRKIARRESAPHCYPSISSFSTNRHFSGFGAQCGRERPLIPRWEFMRLMKRVALSATAMAICATFLAPISAADPTAHLKSEIDAARSESGCPPLRADPVLNNVSQRVAREVDDYIRHTARALPTAGENDLVPTGTGGLSRVMRESGYPTNRLKLLSGYGDYRTGGTGDNESKAIEAAVLQGLGFEALTDCARYTKYGLSAINDDPSQAGWPSTSPRSFSVAAVVVAGD